MWIDGPQKCRAYNELMLFGMKVSRSALITVVFALALAISPLPIAAQENVPTVAGPSPAVSSNNTLQERNASPHKFLDRNNLLLFSGIAVFRILDYTSTRNMLARGREEILIPDDVVHNTAGFASLEAAGAATSIGISYLLHRTGHHKLEHWLSIGHIGVTGFGAARNYALESRHP